MKSKNKIRATDYFIDYGLARIAEIVILFLGVGLLFALKAAEAWYLLPVQLLSAVMCYISVFLLKKRFLMRVEVTQEFYASYSGKKLCCTVLKDSPIYYAIFKSGEATKSVVPYIVFSNHKLLNASNQKRLSTYDMAQEIIMQYNQTTWQLFDTENWICVGGEELVREWTAVRE